MVYEALQYYRQGFKIYANFGLKAPFEYTPLNKRTFDAMIKSKEGLTNAVLLLDEVHIWLDSRSSMQKKNKMITYFILQTRKRNVRLLCTTQHLHQIDKRFRDTIDILVFCRNMSNQTSIVNGEQKEMYIQNEFLFQWGEQPPRKRLLYANPIFPLYDTSEMIGYEDPDDE